ncbi:MAG TPA: glycosyltransferase family 4 protein [Steroidobacteraceae bacterium]|nr:glycosyltransferase family 4 protein [Steroidobacteraceae bacterium]
MFVLPWSPTSAGGVNEAVLGLAHALKIGSGFRPLIAVPSWAPIGLPAEVRGIAVIGLQLHDGYEAGPWAAVKSTVRLPSDLAAIARALKIHDVQMVNLNFPSLGGAAFLLLRRMGLYKGKIALTFHGSDIRRAAGSGSIVRLAWRNYISGADAVLVCSQALANEVQRISPQTHARVIHNGADIDLFSRVPKLRGPGRKRILHIGKFERKKSQDVLLAAFRLLLDRRLDCMLTMIGARGPTLEEVRQAALVFGDRVRVLADVPHDCIPEYMADADLFVLPSRAEPFGIALIEAGAAGLPVVATNVGGIPEIITHGATGLLVEPDNPGALADAMAKVLESAELARSLASSLRAQAARFVWQRAAEQFIAALS